VHFDSGEASSEFIDGRARVSFTPALEIPMGGAMVLQVSSDLNVLASPGTSLAVSLAGAGCTHGIEHIAVSSISNRYLGEIPDHMVVDGLFSDWYSTLPELDGYQEVNNSNIDIYRYGALLEDDAFFYVESRGEVLKGCEIPDIINVPYLPVEVPFNFTGKPIAVPSSGEVEISWKTTHPSIGKVEMSRCIGTPSGRWEITERVRELDTVHSVYMSGLRADTCYRFRVTTFSMNETAGPGIITSQIQYFNTSTPLSQPAFILEPEATGLSERARIEFTTDEGCRLELSFGVPGTTRQDIVIDDYRTYNRVFLSHLEPNTRYEYAIDLWDREGNGPLTYSGEFRTLPLVIVNETEPTQLLLEDTAYIFIDEDSDPNTGFRVQNSPVPLGAEYMCNVTGRYNTVRSATVYMFAGANYSDFIWQEVSDSDAACMGQELEVSIRESTGIDFSNSTVLMVLVAWDSETDVASKTLNPSRSFRASRAAPPPYNIVGYIYDSGMGLEPGAMVMVKNTRTGEARSEIAVDGSYTLALSNGMKSGDTINVTAIGSGFIGYNTGIVVNPGDWGMQIDVVLSREFYDWSGSVKYPDMSFDEPDPNLDLVWTRCRMDTENLYTLIEVRGSALGSTDGGWFQVFIDSDDDSSTGYLLDCDMDDDVGTGYGLDPIGADHLLEIYGNDSQLVTSYLYDFTSHDQMDYNGFSMMGPALVDMDGSVLQTRTPLQDLNVGSGDIKVCFRTSDEFDQGDISDYFIGSQQGALWLTQTSMSGMSITNDGQPNAVLALEVKAWGGDIMLEELDVAKYDFSTAADADVDSISVYKDSVEAANLIDTKALVDGRASMELDQAVANGTTLDLVVAARVSGVEGRALSLTVDEILVDKGVASLVTKEIANAYIGSSPASPVVDGLFSEWLPSYSDGIGDAGSDSIDITGFDAQCDSGSIFLDIEVSEGLLGGAKIPAMVPFTGSQHPMVKDDTDLEAVPVNTVVVVNCTITTDNELDLVKLDYTDTSGGGHNISMNLVGDNIWTASIPGQGTTGWLEYHVWARDSHGLAGSSSLEAVMVYVPGSGAGDVVSPVIVHEQVLDKVAERAINITARITDVGTGVVLATLHYQDSGSHSVPMNRWGGDMYSALIPAQPSGMKVEYSIEAEDGAGNIVEIERCEILIHDPSAPVITVDAPGSVFVHQDINITAELGNMGASTNARLIYHDQWGSHNISMVCWDGNLFSYMISSIESPITIPYFIWAENSIGSGNRTREYSVVVKQVEVLPPMPLDGGRDGFYALLDTDNDAGTGYKPGYDDDFGSDYVVTVTGRDRALLTRELFGWNSDDGCWDSLGSVDAAGDLTRLEMGLDYTGLGLDQGMEYKVLFQALDWQDNEDHSDTSVSGTVSAKKDVIPLDGSPLVLYGYVRDPSGLAVPGAKVNVTDVTNGNATTVTTDGNGRYALDISSLGCEGGDQISVAAAFGNSNGYNSTVLPPVIDDLGGLWLNVTLDYGPPMDPYIIFGYVLDPTGTSVVANATVNVTNTVTGESFVTTSDQYGRYQIDLGNYTWGYSDGALISLYGEKDGNSGWNHTYVNMSKDVMTELVNITLIPEFDSMVMSILSACTPMLLFAAARRRKKKIINTVGHGDMYEKRD